MAAPRESRSPRDFFFGEILRLPPGVRDPDFYTLLGLPFFESDHGSIVRAAMERIRLLECCQADPRPGYQAALQRLLEEVREARMTLLDPARRLEYEHRLIGKDAEGARGPEPADDEAALRTGAMVAGRYRVLVKGREGGFGLLYDAMDANLRTKVQISLLRPRLSADPAHRRRAEQAARAAAALGHPHILPVDEVGDADGLLFLRTRIPEGESLMERIERAPGMRLDPDEVRRIGAGVAQALAHAHAHGVVHGDLRASRIFLDDAGNVQVADFRVARVVADLGGGLRSPGAPPEGDASEAGDLFSLGCVLYQMLAGIPPFAADTTNYHAEPLPPGVPEDLVLTVMRCIAREPGDRPASAKEVVERLRPAPQRRRSVGRLVAVAVVLVVALVAALASRRTARSTAPDSSLKAEAWKLVAQGNYDGAIARVRAALAKDPSLADLHAPLANALEGRAQALERDGALWEAQRLLAEAQALENHAERAKALERVRGLAVERLGSVLVVAEKVSRAPEISIDAGEVPLARVVVGGTDIPLKEGRAHAALDLPEGDQMVDVLLVDAAGNERREERRISVDRTAPAVEILLPEEGATFSDMKVEVKVRVVDEHPPEWIRVCAQNAPLVHGLASMRLAFAEGRQEIPVRVRDLAGLETSVTRTILVETTPPVVDLAAARVVAARGPIRVRGTVRTKGATLLVDGLPAALREDGSFDAEVGVTEDRMIPLLATGSTGIERTLAVEFVRDGDPPALSLDWSRTEKDGTILYGAREMDAGSLPIPVHAADRSAVSFEPSEGVVENGIWTVEAREGVQGIRLVARDEAGNEAVLEARLDGHRSVPPLDVRGMVRERTNDEEITLNVAADDLLLVQGKETDPGRIRIPLPEGETSVLLQAIDHYGNESRWERRIVADRTPPTLTLVGGEERGVGRQDLEVEANEDLESITCVGRTFPVEGRRAKFTADLQMGRRSLHVSARDLAGNETTEKIPLRVVNRALDLDGKSAIRLALPEPLTEFTVECWVRGNEPAGRQVLIGKAAPGGFSLVWSSADTSLPYAALDLDTAGLVTLPARKGWKWEDWTHLALSCDGKRARFFVNGTLQATADLRNALRAGAPEMMIGAEPNGQGGAVSFFRGAIDELRISTTSRYSRPFTPVRFHKEDDQTLVLYRFDSQTGDEFPDTSATPHPAQKATGNPGVSG